MKSGEVRRYFELLVVHGGSLVGVSGRKADKEGRGWCVERLDEWGQGGERSLEKSAKCGFQIRKIGGGGKDEGEG